MEDIEETVKELRLKLHQDTTVNRMPIKGLADAIGIQFNTLWRICRGQHRLGLSGASIETWIKIQNYYTAIDEQGRT